MGVLEWGSIKVPKTVLNLVDQLAKTEGVPRHVIISKALQAYMISQKNVGGIIKGREHVKGKKTPRNVWYAWKLMLSYCELRIAVRYRKCLPPPVIERLIKSFSGTIFQLRERLKVITPSEMEELSKLLKAYISNPSNSTLFPLNDFIRDIFFRVLQK